MVRGIIVRAPTIAQEIVGGLKNLIGGRIGAYTEMCEQARQHAYELLILHAQELGANPIVGLRYDASEVVSKGSSTEVLCYGTAVVVKPIERAVDLEDSIAATSLEAESVVGFRTTPRGLSRLV